MAVTEGVVCRVIFVVCSVVYEVCRVADFALVSRRSESKDPGGLGLLGCAARHRGGLAGGNCVTGVGNSAVISWLCDAVLATAVPSWLSR